MIKLYKEPLSRHTTFRIGGVADILVIPETEAELIEALDFCQKKDIPHYLIGNGSNVLVRDSGLCAQVIKTTKACLNIEREGDVVTVGASVALQQFIRFCVEHDLCGLEYLVSIPGTVGGALYMNAGQGRNINTQISDKLLSVRIFDGNKIVSLNKEECNFEHRYSIFHKQKKWVILEASFKLQFQERSIGEAKIRERLEFTRKNHDCRYPNAGSIFKNGHPLVFKLVRGLRKGSAEYSKITPNWINNKGSARARDIIKLMKYVEFLNCLFFCTAEREIEVW